MANDKKDKLTKIQKQARSIPRAMLTEWKRDLWMKSHEEARFKAQIASGIPTVDAIFNMAYSKGDTGLAKKIADYTSEDSIKSRETILTQKARESRARNKKVKLDKNGQPIIKQPKGTGTEAKGNVTSQRIGEIKNSASTEVSASQGKTAQAKNGFKKTKDNSIYRVKKGGFKEHGPKPKPVERVKEKVIFSTVKEVDGRKLYGAESGLANRMARAHKTESEIIEAIRKNRKAVKDRARDNQKTANQNMSKRRSALRKENREKKLKAKEAKAKKELEKLDKEAVKIGFESHADYLEDKRQTKELRKQEIAKEKQALKDRKFQYLLNNMAGSTEFEELKTNTSVFVKREKIGFQRLMQSVGAFRNLKGQRTISIVLTSNGKERREDPSYYGDLHEKGKGRKRAGHDFTFIKPALENFEKDVAEGKVVSATISAAILAREKKATVTKAYNELAHSIGEYATQKVRVYIEKEKTQDTQEWKFPKNRNLIETRDLLDSISYVVTTKTGRIREK